MSKLSCFKQLQVQLEPVQAERGALQQDPKIASRRIPAFLCA